MGCEVTGERIAAKIRGRIAELGMTSKAVAEKAGIPYQNFSASLLCHRKITGSELLSICSVLGLQFADFSE